MLLKSLAIVLTATSMLAQQQVVHADSSIDRVTVYPGFALVERIVDIPAQESYSDFTVVVSPLPMSAQPSSFQTQVVGEALAVQGLELRSRMSSVANLAQAGKLEQQLFALKEQMIDADADKAGVMLQMKALQNMADYENQASAATWGLPDSVAARLDFFGRQMAKYDVALRTKQLVIDEIKHQISDIDLQINGARKDSGERIREARIHCFAQLLEPSQIRLTYLVSGAQWLPAYDVRISPDLSGVNVSSMGQVNQYTGEDWRQVSLILSTSMPQIGLDPPAVPRRIVNSNERLQDRAGLSSLGYADFANDSMAPSTLESRRSEVVEEELAEYEAAPIAIATDYGITTQFLMPGKVDVAMNGEAHRFSIRTIPLEVSPERYIVPSKSEHAYLRAEVKHTGDSVLLAGKAKIFLGPDYLGESTFPLLRTNDTTMLNLGIDPNLEVNFETLEDYRDDPGSFSLSSTSTITRRYRASLRLSPAAQSKIVVVVEEGLPISTSDSVEVEVLDLVPDAVASEDALNERLEKGLYRWSFSLHPGETKAVRWGYELSFDEDSIPSVREK